MNITNYKSEVIIISVILLISIIITVYIGIHRYGDGASYYAMADSLIKDGDLIVDNSDITRWNRNKVTDIPIGAYITVDKSGVMRFSKPLLYPLIAAPFLFFGLFGVAVLNGLFLGASVVIMYSFARGYFTKTQSLFISVLFVLCSFMPVYAAWITQDFMLFFACCLCIWLGLYKNKAMLAGLIIGVVSSAKILFLLLLMPLIAKNIAKKEFRSTFKIIEVCFLGMAGMFLLNLLFLRQFSAYSGLRGYFFIKSPQYLTLELVKNNLVAGKPQFEGFEFNSWQLFFRNLFNFFIGRFTGIIWYGFPGFISVMIYLLRRKKLLRLEKIAGDSILMVTAAVILILIIARPLNYFGGGGFICNRYFFIFPALFFLPSMRFIKKPKMLVLVFLPGLLISSQLISSQIFVKKIVYLRNKYSFPLFFSAHTHAFPLRYAPLEIFQVESFIVPNLKISENIALYVPLGHKEGINQIIQLNKGQEIVIVRKGNAGNLKLETDYGEIVLEPEIVLRSRVSVECKSFYYFKAKRLAQINDIHD